MKWKKDGDSSPRLRRYPTWTTNSTNSNSHAWRSQVQQSCKTSTTSKITALSIQKRPRGSLLSNSCLKSMRNVLWHCMRLILKNSYRKNGISWRSMDHQKELQQKRSSWHSIDNQGQVATEVLRIDQTPFKCWTKCIPIIYRSLTCWILKLIKNSRRSKMIPISTATLWKSEGRKVTQIYSLRDSLPQ